MWERTFVSHHESTGIAALYKQRENWTDTWNNCPHRLDNWQSNSLIPRGIRRCELCNCCGSLPGGSFQLWYRREIPSRTRWYCWVVWDINFRVWDKERSGTWSHFGPTASTFSDGSESSAICNLWPSSAAKAPVQDSSLEFPHWNENIQQVAICGFYQVAVSALDLPTLLRNPANRRPWHL